MRLMPSQKIHKQKGCFHSHSTDPNVRYSIPHRDQYRTDKSIIVAKNLTP